MTDRVLIRRLPTGVPGLDQILGGGLPEFSFNLIAGAPGAGKTTLAQQIMFSLASADRPALYFTVVGEPPLKMLRYQQQYSFFDSTRVNESIRYINLSHEVVDGTLEKLLARIVQEVEATNPGVVIVDSFRTVAQAAAQGPGRRPRPPAFRAAAGRPAHHLAGHHVSRRRVSALGSGTEPGLHGGRRTALAHAERRQEFHGSQGAGHEDARAGAHSRAAHLPHHVERHPGVPPGHRRAGGQGAAPRDGRGAHAPRTALDRHHGNGRHARRRRAARLLGARLRALGLGQERARPRVHQRGRQSRRTRHHRGVREAAQRALP